MAQIADQDKAVAGAIADASLRLDALAETAELRRGSFDRGSGEIVWRVWGKGPALVLLHGGHGSWRHWFHNIAPLAQHFQLYVADMAGQGDSDMAPQPYDADSLALLLHESLQQVMPDDQHFGIVGFSFGSVIGAVLAALQTKRLTSYVGVGSAGYGPRPTVADDLRPARRGFSLSETFAAHHHNVSVLMMADDAKIDGLATTIQMQNAGKNRIQSRPISLTDAMLRSIAHINAPIGYIWGEKDITAFGGITPYVGMIHDHRPDALIEVLPDAGHWVQFEDPANFNTLLPDLIARLTR
jgi:pimeloyl-ACP methyl ester carboxylesterase